MTGLYAPLIRRKAPPLPPRPSWAPQAVGMGSTLVWKGESEWEAPSSQLRN